MSNSSLEQLPKTYNLPVKKMVGDLDYNKIRHSKTYLTDEELGYCENDCLVLYHYIMVELESYLRVDKIPLTSTGHVRKELKDRIKDNYNYKSKVRKSVNINPHIYNLLVQAFQGGYTHANWIYADEIIKHVNSYDETSAYPYVMVTYKFPSTEFRKCNIKRKEEMISSFAYLLHIDLWQVSTLAFS